MFWPQELSYSLLECVRPTDLSLVIQVLYRNRGVFKLRGSPPRSFSIVIFLIVEGNSEVLLLESSVEDDEDFKRRRGRGLRISRW